MAAVVRLSPEDWNIVGFTVWTATVAIACDLVPGLLLAWVLARKSWPGKTVIETIASLPLVLPPVATGLLLLELVGRRGCIGALLYRAGVEVAFTWKAVVLAMAVVAFPFIVRGGRVAFEGVSPRLEQVASTLGASRFRIARTITLPLAGRGIAAGVVIAFTRALGEFGATILVAGNIPGYTTTLSTSIYSKIMLGRDAEALAMIVVSIALAFLLTFASESLVRSRVS